MPIFLSNIFAAVCLPAGRVGLPPRGLSAGWSTSRVRSASGGSTSVRGGCLQRDLHPSGVPQGDLPQMGLHSGGLGRPSEN